MVVGDASAEKPPHPPSDSARLRVSMLYFAVYLHLGVIGPFLPLWLSYRGLSAPAIGFLVALPLVLKPLTAPLISYAGRRGQVRLAIGLSAAVAAMLMFGVGAVNGATPLVALLMLFMLAWEPLPPLVDTYALMGSKGVGYDFGRVRFWGSLAFLVANALGGYGLGRLGLQATPFVSAALLILPLLLLRALPSDFDWIKGEASWRGDWRLVLRDRVIMLAILAVALIQGSHGLLTAFSSIGWAARGMSTGTIGVLWAIALASEMALLWFGGRLLGGRDPCLLLVIAGVAATVRWAAMATSPPLPWLCLLQALQGISAMGAVLSVFLLIARRLPNHLVGAAQAIATAVVGITQAGVLAASGQLWHLGPDPAYGAMTVIAALGTACAIAASSLSHRPRPPAVSRSTHPGPVKPEA